MRVFSNMVACVAFAGSGLASANAAAQRVASAPLHIETLYADSAGHIYFRGRRIGGAAFDSATPAIRAQREVIFFSWAGSPALRTAGEDSVYAHLTRDHVNFELRADSTLHAKVLPDRFSLVPRTRMITHGDTMFELHRWESGGVDTTPRFVAHEHSGEYLWPSRRPMTPEAAAYLHVQLAQIDESNKALVRVLANTRRLYVDAAGRIYQAGEKAPVRSVESALHPVVTDRPVTVWLSWAGAPAARNSAQDSAFRRILATHVFISFRTDSTPFSRQIRAPSSVATSNPDLRTNVLERGDTEYVVHWTIHDNHFDTVRVLLYRGDSVIRIRPLPRLAMPPAIADVMRRARAATHP